LATGVYESRIAPAESCVPCGDREPELSTLDLFAGIGVNVSPRDRGPGQSGEKHGFLDRREAAIRVEGDVGELGGAIAADTPPGHGGESRLQHLWNNRHED